MSAGAVHVSVVPLASRVPPMACGTPGGVAATTSFVCASRGSGLSSTPGAPRAGA